MSEKPETSAAKEQVQAAKPQSVGKMSIAEIDAEFTKVETATKQINESVKAALAGNQPVNVESLRQLQKLTQRRTKLIIQRIRLLMCRSSDLI